ncbi:MAG: 4Fe-4S binding protein [Treponemataceae bacterium]
MIVVFLLYLLFCILFIGFSFFLFRLVQQFQLSFLPKTTFQFHNEFEIDYNDAEIIPSAPVNKKAFIYCNAKRVVKKTVQYIGITDCSLIKSQYNNTTQCIWGCIGLGNCVRVCPQNAIIIKNDTALVTDLCTGCGKCIAACPNSLIQLTPTKMQNAIACSTQDGEEALAICSKACTDCRKCVEKNKPYKTINYNFTQINPENPVALSEEELKICPQNCIVKNDREKTSLILFLDAYYQLIKQIQTILKKWTPHQHGKK